VLGLSFGELFVIGFIVVAILSARYWPLLGERAALFFSGTRERRD